MTLERLFGRALALCALLTAVDLAQADEVSGLRSTLIEEVAHHVSITLDRGHASLVVERSVFNGGPRHDEATFFIDLPEGAVATGLRTLGSFQGHPKWFEGDLLEAEAAAAKYRELTGIGGYYPKDPALLSWRDQRRLALQVFPCPPAAEKKVEYTLLLPTHYRHGAQELVLPAMGTANRLASVRVKAKRPGDRVSVNGRSVTPRTLLEMQREKPLVIQLFPTQSAFVEGNLAEQVTKEQRFLRQFELFVAPRLSEVPKAADVVLVLDASRSIPDETRQGMLAAARAYLSHLPKADVALVSFDRSLHTPLGGFATVEQTMLDLEWLTLHGKNGSDVESALFTADSMLAARPKGPVRRIVLFTDALTHSKLSPERLRGALFASGALLHIGIVGGSGTTLERDDEHAWNPVARHSGGLVWQAGVTSESDAFEALKSAYEEWVRPLHIHQLSLDTHGRVELGEVPSMLREGEGFVNLGLDNDRVTEVTLKGELWTEPVQRSIRVTPEASRRWSALVFGSELFHELSEAEMLPLAFEGGAVSPVTSYLAIEPGVRPSTEGIDYTGTGMGWGASAPQLRMAYTSVGPPAFDHHAWLDARLKTAWRHCGGRGSVSVGFETTKNEVVMVDEVRGLGSRDAVAERCLLDAAWELDLPEAFTAEREGWQLFVDA